MRPRKKFGKKVPPGKNHFHDFILQSKEKQILCTLALHGWIYQFEPHPLIRQFENQIEIRENNIILFCFVEKLHIIYFSKIIEVCSKKNKTVMYMICNC